MSWYNPIVLTLLRSPLHPLLGSSTAAITVTGRRSGKPIELPVNTIPDGDALLTMSLAERTWWRNLRGGASVRLWMGGKRFTAWGDVMEASDAVQDGLMAILRERPSFAGYLKVELDQDQKPLDPQALARAATGRVIIRLSQIEPV